jgi:folate-dependent tRNA-U54 methylase TrmFO/GidA
VADESGDYIVGLVVNDSFVDSDAISVTVTAITTQQVAINVLLDTIEVIKSLDPVILKNGNATRDALINKIEAAIGMIEKQNYGVALGKLENDILGVTNGCVISGQPESNDWILTCEGQSQVYPLIVEAIELLQNLI